MANRCRTFIGHVALPVYGNRRERPGKHNICWSATVNTCAKIGPAPVTPSKKPMRRPAVVHTKKDGSTYIVDNDDGNDQYNKPKRHRESR